MIVDTMKLVAAALSACRGLLDRRREWLSDAARALDITEETGQMRVELELSPDPLLQRHLTGPPGRRTDGPWSAEEQPILDLLRLGIAQLEALEASGDGRALSQVAALLEPLPGALRGGRRRFDARLFRQHIRSLSLPWHLLLPEFQQLLQDNAAVRQPLPDRR